MLIALVGPTGSGKTDIALKLSDILDNAPIINCDAFQIYQDMNIGTAKISEDSPYFKRHYLLNIRKPNEEYSVAEYQKDFRQVYEELKKTNKDVIVVGGTGLYLRAALYDYEFPIEQIDDTSDLEAMSNDELYELLAKLDPEALETIHKNNRKRVIRAISYARTHEVTKSENISSQNHQYIYPKEDVKIFFLNPPRDELYERINQRVDSMISLGLVEETKGLIDRYQLSKTASQAIGYKEIISYLNDEMGLEEATELIKKRTRNYAKRQVTFFKHQFETIEVHSLSDILEEIQK